MKVYHFSHFQFQLCHQRSLLKCHCTFYIYGPQVHYFSPLPAPQIFSSAPCSLNYFLCSLIVRLFSPCSRLPGCFGPHSPGSLKPHAGAHIHMLYIFLLQDKMSRTCSFLLHAQLRASIFKNCVIKNTILYGIIRWIAFLSLMFTINKILIVCLRVNQELCYSSLIYGPTAFASVPVSNYSRGNLKSHTKRILCFKLHLKWIQVCTGQFPDSRYIGDCMVSSETAN